MTTSLSIVMPVYNEERTVSLAIERVLAVEFPCKVELIVVNDGSADRTGSILGNYTARGVNVMSHRNNAGKGAAVRTGVAEATGSHIIILDSDLEYSPADIPRMLEPIMTGRANHVFGVRVFGFNSRFTSFKFAVGGRATTWAANLLYDAWLSDMHTCLKLIPTADFRAVDPQDNGFGLDTEVTARLLRAGVRPFEVPISYHGRGVSEGKKINWRDGLECLRILVQQRVRRPLDLPVGSALPDLQPISPSNSWLEDEAEDPIRAV